VRKALAHLAALKHPSFLRRAFPCAIFALALCPVPYSVGAMAGYRITFLGELEPNGSTTAHALNNCGQVVGESGGVDGANVRAFSWEVENPIQSLGGLPGTDYSQAFGLNDKGVIVGTSNAFTALRAVIWQRDGKTREIGTLPGDVGSQASAINSKEQVVGFSSGSHGSRAFLWTEKDGMSDLGGLPGGDYTQATAINDASQVVGFSGKAGAPHAFFWELEGGMVDLGTLPGDRTSEAFAINNHGLVVGSSRGAKGTHAFLWSKGEGMKSLGILPGGTSSVGLSVNDSGEVVGLAGDGAGYRGFLWTNEGGMKDLNALIPLDSGVLLVGAFAINNRGQIATYGGLSNAHTHHFNAPRAYLLTPSSSSQMAKGPACSRSSHGAWDPENSLPVNARLGSSGAQASNGTETRIQNLAR
jgi:probable HAF family extracellular repeat protein